MGRHTPSHWFFKFCTDEEPIGVASDTNHLRATAARQFRTNYARKYRFLNPVTSFAVKYFAYGKM